jgi:hypothetical protein
MRFAILCHATDTVHPGRHLIHDLARRWTARGIDVVVRQGVRAPPDADGAVLHVDRTFTPARYLRYATRYPAALNDTIRSISKRRVSTLRVMRGDGYAGPVIVKSVLNHGGVPEFESWGNSRRLQSLRKIQRLPWWVSGMFLPSLQGYPIYDSSAAVPRAVWLHPLLIVERLMVERHSSDAERYVLRHWTFLGDRDMHYHEVRHGSVAGRGNVIERGLGGPVPAELRAVRAAYGFDYGKFDYVIVDGRIVLFDCNRTPGAGVMHVPQYAAAFDNLSLGLETAIEAARQRRGATPAAG